MTKNKVLLVTIVLWLIGCTLYGYYYITSTLSLPEPYDAYARNWQFQLLAFSLVRLPFLVIVLGLLIGIELFLFVKMESRER